MHIRNAAFRIVCGSAILAINSTLAQSSNLDRVVPKPEGLYEGYTVTPLPGANRLVAGGIERQRSGFGRGPDGKSLWGPGYITNKATLSDPAAATWTNTAAMSTKRAWHAATLLANGRVLVSGGQTGRENTANAEIYDPVSGTWAETGSLNTARRGHTATLLAEGKVLATGGVADSTNQPREVYLSSTEL